MQFPSTLTPRYNENTNYSNNESNQILQQCFLEFIKCIHLVYLNKTLVQSPRKLKVLIHLHTNYYCFNKIKIKLKLNNCSKILKSN